MEAVQLDRWRDHCRREFEGAWGRLMTGEGGLEVQVQEPATDTAGSSTDRTYRKVIGPL
jgi:hypothetical protein